MVPPQQLADLLIKNVNAPSDRNLSALLPFFGQFIYYEIIATGPGCPVEVETVSVHDIAEDKNKTEDETEAKSETGVKSEIRAENGVGAKTPMRKMLYRRNAYDSSTGQSPGNPREQLNQVTPIIDGSLIYGTSSVATNRIRTFKDGTLIEEDQFPIPLADSRGNENPAIYSLIALFRSFHNKMALYVGKRMAEKSNEIKPVEDTTFRHAHTEEDVFQATRRITISVLQKIAFYEFLPGILNMNDTEMASLKYVAYDSSIDPRPSHEYAVAAGRYYHTLVPPGIILDNNETLLSCNYGTNPIQRMKANNVTPGGILEKLSNQLAESGDPFIFNGNGIIISTILSGRDHGVPGYLFVWQCLMNGDKIPENVDKVLRRNNLTDVDLFIGGMIESDEDAVEKSAEKEGAKPGKLFSQIMRKTFLNLRNGDRFWFENHEMKHLLNKLRVWQMIDEMTLGKLINIVHGIDVGDAFVTKDGIFLNHDIYREKTDKCEAPKVEEKSKDKALLIIASLLLSLILPLGES